MHFQKHQLDKHYTFPESSIQNTVSVHSSTRAGHEPEQQPQPPQPQPEQPQSEEAQANLALVQDKKKIQTENAKRKIAGQKKVDLTSALHAELEEFAAASKTDRMRAAAF